MNCTNQNLLLHIPHFAEYLPYNYANYFSFLFLGLSTLDTQEGLLPQNDSFIYNVLGGRWTKLKQTENPELLPSPRSHMAGFKQGLNAFVVYGGLDSTGKPLGDVWYGQMGTQLDKKIACK
jgi:hypothetical protein